QAIYDLTAILMTPLASLPAQRVTAALADQHTLEQVTGPGQRSTVPLSIFRQALLHDLEQFRTHQRRYRNAQPLLGHRLIHRDRVLGMLRPSSSRTQTGAAFADPASAVNSGSLVRRILEDVPHARASPVR